MSARYVVRLGPLYATGGRAWTLDERRAFVFEDGGPPYAKAEAWARAHAASLKGPFGGPYAGLEPAVEGFFGEASFLTP